MAIACAYCGGAHAAPADVRACWERGGRPEVPASDDPGGRPDERRAPTPAPAAQRRTGDRRRAEQPIPRGLAPARPGPDGLGRHLVVAPGGDVAPQWAGASRLVIDAAALDDVHTLDRLRDAHHRAERLVIELATPFDEHPRQVADAPPFALGPRFAFHREELFHLVWSNSLDGRQPAPRWSALDLAISRGGRAVTDDGPGDIELPDGGRAWIDGGPVRVHDPIDGVPVLHVVAVECASWSIPRVSGGASSADELAPDQLAAVTHRGGGARIIAPAGSGKTRVLTERARHLLRAWQLPADAVSLVAFNKRAQEEMQARTADLPGLNVRTLNSIALAIVNGTAPFAPQPRSWRTIDEPEVRRILGDLARFPRRRNSDPVAPWIEALGSVRLGLVDPDRVEAEGEDIDGFAAVWPRYREALERRGVVDFDDQIHRALLVLLTDPHARQVAQRACRVMLVDEFQDLTPGHLLLVRLLAAPGGAVFGVGDDDQTIYGYNGADPGWLIDFGALFPGSGDHPLEVNYRCPGGVVEAVDRLLRHNRRRVAKTIRAASTDDGGWSVDGRTDAVAATLDVVRSALDGGAAPEEVAVLTRVNAVLAPVQVSMAAAGIPFAGGVGVEFVDRTAVAAVLAWVRLATAPRDTLAADDLREALRRPSRSFHPRIADWICEQRSVVDLHRLATRLNKERDAERVAEFAADIQALQRRVESGGITSDVVLALIDEIGLAGSVATLDTTRRGMNRASQGDDLTAIAQLAALHDDPRTFERWLRARLATPRDRAGVVLSTVHRVKGQEWPHVVVHHADAEQYPHRLADDVEEERRLFHVALTRARVAVTVVTGSRPSPFVAELSTEPSAVAAPVTTHRPSADVPSRPRRDDPEATLDPAAKRRYQALRDLRNELRDGKPAYVVFDNRTLLTIAREVPTTLDQLARINGVGPAKLERYGTAVVELMARMSAS